MPKHTMKTGTKKMGPKGNPKTMKSSTRPC